MKFLDSTFDGFTNLITNNIKVGLMNLSSKCYLEYQGIYYQEISDGITNPHSDLNEIIEEVIHDECFLAQDCYPTKHYLVTRQIGTDDPSIWKPNTRISLIREENGKIYSWVPTFKELFEYMRRLITHPWGGHHHIGNLKKLNEKLCFTKEFNTWEVIQMSGDDRSGVYRENFLDYIPISAYYALLKQILISEDIRYNLYSQFGRYLTITALFDFINSDKTFDEIKNKYKFRD